MYRYITVMLTAAALSLPIAAVAQDRDDHNRDRQEQRYEDRAHKDTHTWNENEDRAYRRYLQEHHKKYHEFSKANRRDQENYWNWRHAHNDDDRH